MAAQKKTVNRAPTIQNRRARHDYEVIESFEAGIQLVGSEVKSIREGHVQLTDCYGRIMDGEAWLIGMHIQPYSNATSFGAHDPDRHRKLLLHKREIAKMDEAIKLKGLVLVPLTMRFNDDGRVKIDVALARGKKSYDKRASIAARDSARDAERESSRRR